MNKNGKKYRRTKRSKNNMPLILTGVGLLLIGVVSAAVILNTQKANSASDPASEEYSVTPVEVNYPAPELTLNDLEGTAVSLSDHLGSVVLVNNWATWCPPCKAEMPTLQTYYTWHEVQGFTLLAIEAGDPLPDVAAFVESYQLTFPILLDPNNLALRAFQNDGLPNSYVIDRQGIVRLAWTGPISLEMLERYVTPIVEE
ncbi:MAG TPA: TlpA disulfide reductase family protein [Anaerolineales bacterium]|nr:TlpA disulfide reductase family protein [Anaerolineales bacterium]